MATVAQKKAQQEKTDKSARMLAYLVMGVMLTLSLAANVLTAWDHDLVSKVVAGIPPVSLFLTSSLFERMRSSLVVRMGMALTIFVSLVFSWYHIAQLAIDHHQPALIAWMLPVIIDVPMLFAGKIVIDQKLPATITPATATATKTVPATPKASPIPKKSVATAKKSTTTTNSIPATA